MVQDCMFPTRKKKKLRHVARQLRFATNTLCDLSLLALTVCIMLTVVLIVNFIGIHL